MRNKPTRRRLLTAGGLAGLLGLSGCLRLSAGEDGETPTGTRAPTAGPAGGRTGATPTESVDGDATAVVDGFEDGGLPDHWSVTDPDDSASVAVTTERAYAGNGSLRVSAGDPLAIETDLDGVTLQDGDEFHAWVYTESPEASVTLRLAGGPAGSPAIRLTRFGTVVYDTTGSERTALGSDDGVGGWHRLGLRVYPSVEEVQFSVRQPDGTTVLSDRVESPGGHESFVIRGGGGRQGDEFYLDEVTAGPVRR
ncbi:hypothetical protein NDI56_11180 [Haloarcula sp. S1CR25-12]|uniref:Uncharacterized protein n=1 Tax=Haloarcula saliterrae TaxID=2950534 RepID=A0ABU2FCM1_9EURY|nr:hypothetical protein [Haloarcula sp. S1CR25-12]MDS0259957.1 hypothetical protein [Haloarcula sp. S1CR25-12]